MRRLRDPLFRLAYRVGYRLLRLWWLVASPSKEGVKCVLTREREVLLVRHTYGRTDRWELPGGGVKRRETPEAAATRETREELGLDVEGWAALGDLFDRSDRKRDHLWCFSAGVDGQAVEIDRAEIAEARWFARDALPEPRARYVERIVGLSARRPGSTSAPPPRSPRARG